MKSKTILLLSVAAIAFSSCAKYYSMKGNRAYESLAYQNAVHYYEKYLTKKSSDEVKIKLANSYRMNNDYANAERLYSEIVTIPGIELAELLNYAKLLMNEAKYDEAKIWLTKYLKLKQDDFAAEMLLVTCNSANKNTDDTSLYTIKPVHIPDVASAFGAVKYGDGIVFSADKETAKSSKKSGWTGHTFLDLYYSQKNSDGTWESPQLLKGEINGEYHEAAATFNKEGNVVYFTRSNYFTKKKLGKNNKNESNLKIFRAELKDGRWTNLEELPFNSDDYSCGHPTLTADGNTLYFISDMPGGLGGTDIYKTNLIGTILPQPIARGGPADIERTNLNFSGTSWSKPENLGPTINTDGNEMFPSLNTDGKLYFSSDANKTIGGLDVFSTTCNETKCLVPEHLHMPLNSTKDDFSFNLKEDNKTGYVTSNRDGSDKIYEVTKNDPTFILSGTVTLKDENTPIKGALIEIINADYNTKDTVSTGEDGKYKIRIGANKSYSVRTLKKDYNTVTLPVKVSTIGKTNSEVFKSDFILDKAGLTFMLTGIVTLKADKSPIEGAVIESINTTTNTKEKVVTGKDGKYTIALNPDKAYSVRSLKEGYYTLSIPVEVSTVGKKKSEVFNSDFLLDKIVLDKPIVMENIYYDLGKWAIRKDAKTELDKLITLMNDNPKISIELGSHTDSRASDKSNMELSQKRAKATVDYLSSKGIDAKRLTWKGYGETQLINGCKNGVKCTEEEYQKNRRTEFKVTKMK